MEENPIGWRGGFCIEVSPVPNTLVIFGASGDLTHRKLIPALFSLYRKKLFHEKSRIIGCARTDMNDEAFREKTRQTLKVFCNGRCDEKKLEDFLEKVFYVSGPYDDISTYKRISERIEGIEKELACPNAGRVYYLSTPVNLYGTIVGRLGEAGLVTENYEGLPWRNVIIEKPFGHDLESAKKLDRELRLVLQERQIYRIDHYLGKETVQNILMMRFANRIFEPIWNNHYIENVQITVAESIGVEHRAGYYEQAGLLRDMFQNHVLQMLALVAMEVPPSFEANKVRDEKVKLLSSIRPFNKDRISEEIVRAQYAPGIIDGREVPGYRQEEGINPDSMIETYAAARLFIDNWRWQGVPFYLRSGKRMKKRLSEIVITFKRVPHSIFTPIRARDLAPNVLVLNVQPEEGLALTIQAKQPGPKLCMGGLTLDFKYDEIFKGEKPEAYERLLLDCMLGDQTLFIRSDNIENAWSLLTPVLEAWQNNSDGKSAGQLYKYSSGSWGPEEAEELMYRDGYSWRNI